MCSWFITPYTAASGVCLMEDMGMGLGEAVKSKGGMQQVSP